jgi:hypothetical protein
MVTEGEWVAKDVKTPVGASDALNGLRGNIGTFQVLIRLQHLRAQVGGWTGYGSVRDPDADRLQEVLWALRGMEVAARAAGLDAYAQVCQHLAEQVRPLCGGANIHWSLLHELCAWIVSSDRYLRHPTNPSAVADMVARLNALPWDSPLSQDDQGSLFRALLQPG